MTPVSSITPKIIKEAVKELKEDEIKPFVPTDIKKENEKSAHSHLTNYLTEVITPPQTKSKKKNKKTGKKLFPTLLVALLSILALVGVGGGVYYFIQTNAKAPAAVETKTEETTEQSDSDLPKEIVPGYVLDGQPSASDNTYEATYVFSGDKTRTITFSRKQTTDGKADLQAALKDSAEEYSVTTSGEVEYAQTESGSVFWTKGENFYKLTVKGETYPEKVYDMALSVE
jgi:hypothetical protein